MLIINDFADSQWEESKKTIYEKVSECRRHTCERNIMCVCEWEGAHDTLQSQVVVLIRRGSVWKRFWVKAWRFQTEREAFVLMDRSSLWALISTFASIYTICFFFIRLCADCMCRRRVSHVFLFVSFSSNLLFLAGSFVFWFTFTCTCCSYRGLSTVFFSHIICMRVRRHVCIYKFPFSL